MAPLDAMMAAVYANPADDLPRERLAAELSRRGDPRGEFIELQLSAARGGRQSRADRSRERALRDAHVDAWLEPLRGALVKRSVKFERGFPVSGRLAFAKDPEALPGTPALATLEHLDVEGGNVVHDPGFLARFIFESPLRGLKSLRGTYRSQLEDFLTSDPPWALERLAFATEGGGGPSGELRMLAQIAQVARVMPEASGLPYLTELALSYTSTVDPEGKYGWLWSTALGRRLVALRMNHRPTAVVPWVEALNRNRQDLALKSVEFFATSSFNLERTARGWTRLRGTLPERELDARVARSALNGVAEKLGPDFELVVPGYERPTGGP